MNKRIISIPEGVFYLTDYQYLSSQLTDRCYILNKVMTGCGATTFFLSDNKATVLCVPRRELAFCKATHLNSRVKYSCLPLNHMSQRMTQALSWIRYAPCKST